MIYYYTKLKDKTEMKEFQNKWKLIKADFEF